jgi:hypothetical protein
MAMLATVAAGIALLLAPTGGAGTLWVTRGWAGYVVRAPSASFNQASASWTQPRVVCNRPGSSVAIWTGLGGTRSQSRALEQVGTSADCSDRGLGSHSAWYQLFPSAPVDVPVPVKPGDRVHAAVTVAGWVVSVTFTNLSTGGTFSVETWSREAEVESAEWIVEAPSACFSECSPLPVADFGRVTFTEASTSVDTFAGAIDDPRWSRLRLKMAPHHGRTVAAPTRLSEGGSSFSVVRLRPSPAR